MARRSSSRIMRRISRPMQTPVKRSELEVRYSRPEARRPAGSVPAPPAGGIDAGGALAEQCAREHFQLVRKASVSERGKSSWSRWSCCACWRVCAHEPSQNASAASGHWWEEAADSEVAVEAGVVEVAAAAAVVEAVVEAA
eukprot:6199620-Pleurochrysis_carterae.AAC.1